jgi:hypothetical protein
MFWHGKAPNDAQLAAAFEQNPETLIINLDKSSKNYIKTF